MHTVALVVVHLSAWSHASSPSFASTLWNRRAASLAAKDHAARGFAVSRVFVIE